MSLSPRLKRWIFRLLGKEPEAVVVSFATGPPELAARMFEEIQQLVPGRRHFLIAPTDFASPRALRRRFRPYRVALAPVLFTGEPEYRRLRWAAFLMAPTKILAYNRRLERHHLRLRTWIASLLFLKHVPLDRIFLRPSWLFPWKRDGSVYPTSHLELTGRPFSPGRRRIAVLTPYFPYPLSHGGAVRIFNLLREIAERFDVVLFSFTDQDQPEAAPLLETCARIVVVKQPRYREPRWSTLAPPEVAEFRSQVMQREIGRLRREIGFEALQVEYTAVAPYEGEILVEHDVTFSLYRQIYERERTLSTWWNYWRWKRFEQHWIRSYRRVVVMSEDDRKLLDHPNLMVIPNGVDLSRFQPEPERSGRALLFVGSFRHFPNIVAFRFFLEQVWPLVQARESRVTLTVVAGPDPWLHWSQHTGQLQLPDAEGLRIHGFISDVRPYYMDANLVLVPTLVSAGTNLKVLEALAMKRAVVSTTSGCAGLGLQHRENVWIADEPVDFAEAVVQLLDDPGARRRIASAGRLLVEREFDWRQVGSLQRRLLREMLPGSLQLRQATPADVDQICAIQDDSPEASHWEPDDYLAFDCSIAERDGGIVAFLVSREVGPGEYEILNLAVHPEYRRLGLASALIRDQIKRRPGEHFLEVRQSNVAARALYRRLGFREAGVRPAYYENPPEPGIVMRILS